MKTLVSSIVKIYILCLINIYYFEIWIVGKEPKAKGFYFQKIPIEFQPF